MTPSPLEALTAKQLQAAAALARGLTVAAVAQLCAVTERTVHRWLTAPEFKEAIRATRTDLYQATVGHLIRASSEAVSTLETITKDSTTSPTARVSAARSILEYCHRAHVEQELTERLEAIERQLEGLKVK